MCSCYHGEICSPLLHCGQVEMRAYNFVHTLATVVVVPRGDISVQGNSLPVETHESMHNCALVAEVDRLWMVGACIHVHTLRGDNG